MFSPKTERLIKLGTLFPTVVSNLEGIFDEPTLIYVDYANVVGWFSKLGWRTDLKRLRQFFDCFTNISKVRLYYGKLSGDPISEAVTSEAKKNFPDFVTKEVKIKNLSIDASSISPQSPDLLKQFVRKTLLDKLSLTDVEYLNNRLRDLNSKGTMFIQDRKCNFDVEIGIRMLKDKEDFPKIRKYILWSGDCDFDSPVQELISKGKKVVIFAPRGFISTELTTSGAQIYEVRPLKNFVCQSKQIDVIL